MKYKQRAFRRLADTNRQNAEKEHAMKRRLLLVAARGTRIAAQQ
ncbi:MAG TPA: hypothetical protein VGV38_20610 [Pyrinomonadaceae bacterium]|nr:hypothetical protein [Pyrinomonadaceae bacterium]